MPHDSLVALLIFAFVTSVTPGPNNMMLMASGANFGFRPTIPHMFGIELGFAVLILAVGLGLGAFLLAVPAANMVLKVAGAAYLLWLSWKVASARTLANGAANAKPLGFFAASAFQWVNPKAWAMAVGAAAVYIQPGREALTLGLVVLAFMLSGLVAQPLWTGFGVGLRQFLSDPVRLKWFNITMGVLMASSLWPMLR
jgi:threonine/homoserine/homoserine lactone efflux protein